MQNNGAISSVDKSAKLDWLSESSKIDRSGEFADKLAASEKEKNRVIRVFTIHNEQTTWHSKLIDLKCKSTMLAVALAFLAFLPSMNRQRALLPKTNEATAGKAKCVKQ